MRKIICEIFEIWLKYRVSWYFKGFTYPKNTSGLYYASLNPYINTEDDIKVKFGGFLEEQLLFLGYTVHSEQTGIYSSKKGYHSRPDLSIHEVDKRDGLWLYNDPSPIISSLRAVIEIKYINYRDPNYLFRESKIDGDIDKLAELKSNLKMSLVETFLLLFDEGGEIEDEHIIAIRSKASKHNVTILSNNPELNTCYD